MYSYLAELTSIILDLDLIYAPLIDSNLQKSQILVSMTQMR